MCFGFLFFQVAERTAARRAVRGTSLCFAAIVVYISLPSSSCDCSLPSRSSPRLSFVKSAWSWHKTCSSHTELWSWASNNLGLSPYVPTSKMFEMVSSRLLNPVLKLAKERNPQPRHRACRPVARSKQLKPQPLPEKPKFKGNLDGSGHGVSASYEHLDIAATNTNMNPPGIYPAQSQMRSYMVSAVQV